MMYIIEDSSHCCAYLVPSISMANFRLNADEDLQAALAAQAGGTIAYESGECIFWQGQEASGLLLVASGAVRLYMQSSCRKTLMERVAIPGCILGLPSTITGEAYSLAAEAIGRTELICVSRENVLRLLQHDSMSSMKLLA